MAKILVVDDEPDLETLIRQKYRKQIRTKEFEFCFACDGVEALQKLDDHKDVDLVLTDINMPNMDGLTLVEKLNETQPLLQTIIVSAYGDMENIRSAMNKGAYDFVTKPIDFYDLTRTLEKTLDYVDQIKQTLRAVKENNILKMYVDESVLSFMDTPEYESNLMESKTIEGSVIFVDVCGFTAISESATPTVVVNLINTYFDVMVKEIVAQDGVIDKFIGDALMAVFTGNFHLDRAVDAALSLRSQINALDLSESGSYQPKLSIGIKSGEMVSGNIGSASLRRLDYTVIGDTVNTAARLQDAAAPDQIVIDKACYDQIKNSFKCKELPGIQVKNKTAPLHIFEVIE